MFYAKTRRIAELEARTAMLRRKLDTARGTDQAAAPVQDVPDWEGIAKQLAKDRVDAERAAAREIAHLKKDKRSAERLARAVVRYWSEIGRLRRTVAERDASIKALQDLLADRDGGDRAVMLPPLPGVDLASQVAELKRDNALKAEQIAAQQERLLMMQTANEAKYWRLARRAGAVADSRPLQQAS